nr:immunoglobulin light chain junction region [Macaca mulatta]
DYYCMIWHNDVWVF